jgi:hypothetical protein
MSGVGRLAGCVRGTRRALAGSPRGAVLKGRFWAARTPVAATTVTIALLMLATGRATP